MAAERRFQIPSVVIHQTLDGEAVIINLDNGRYYALNDCGSLIWNALAAGHSAEAMTRAFAPASAERTAIERFLGQLVEQGLIQETPVDHVIVHSPSLPDAPNFFASPFLEPGMEIFTDMERLLPLDPLHEVDERGWPNRKAGPS